METPIRTIVGLTTLALVACGGDGRPAASTEEAVANRVGVVLPIVTQPAYEMFGNALREALDSAGHEIVVEGGIADAAEQGALVQRITGRNARAIVIAPLDSVTLRPAIDAAAAASIPVFTVGVPVPGARVTTHTEPDYHAAGVVAAEYMITFVGPDMHAGVVGALGAHGSRELEAGFRSVMGADTVRKHSGAADGGGTVEGAAAATASLLARDPQLDAIFALDAASGLGAMNAVLAARRADVIIVSFGAGTETLDAVREVRPLRAAVVERPDVAARLLGAAIAAQLDGEPVTPSIKSPVRLVTSDSLRRKPD
jgi:ribose transport system substrate-binding protein